MNEYTYADKDLVDVTDPNEPCEEASYENKHLLDVTDPNEPSEEAYLASFKEGAYWELKDK